MKDIIIIFDSLAIKKEYVYDVKSMSFVGAVNFGNLNRNNNSELATEALFFMAVRLKGHWKQPFDYFLGKPNGANQAQLVKHAVSYLSEKGFIVHGVTCDGCFTNQSTAQMLGCSLDPDNIRPYFPHPEYEKEHIFSL
ncbi:THAP domain-containing protein 9 [Elysia marginata]|uniref:THAP domain-containing protein 9 n=1 Tax=Elysia marginata TaxID=1093978 RepID=A0AAV4HKS5_9GAST|nr:THAP domain-containing protein 9 [Elysia marginata]